MKTLRVLFLIAFVAFFAACSDDDNGNDNNNNGNNGNNGNNNVTEATYIGTLIVNDTDSTTYTQQNVSLIVGEIVSDNVNITMKGVSFSSQMPLTLDMKIKGITAVTDTTSEVISLSGDGLIPIAMGGEFPMYTVTDLTGEIKEKKLSLSMTCGTFPLSYSGTHKE